jgi:hypothetical protein
MKQNQATVLECDFQMYKSFYGNEYTCVAKNFQTSLNDRNITDVKGDHLPDRTNFDVKQLMIKKQACPYLPLNIASYFKNLQVYYVMNSNTHHLLKGDLDGLTYLKIFDVSHNPVEQLGSSFFEGHESIEIVSFYDCHLKIIAPDALDPLINLKEAYFQMNSCIDFETKSNFAELKIEITDKCQNHNYNGTIFHKNGETSMCSSPEISFVKQNSYIIITLLSVLTIVLSFVIVKIKRTRFGDDWTEFKNVLL